MDAFWSKSQSSCTSKLKIGFKANRYLAGLSTLLQHSSFSSFLMVCFRQVHVWEIVVIVEGDT